MRVLILTFVILAPNALAEKPSWNLTLEERAMLRADPQANAERHRASVHKGRPAEEASATVIDGSVEPASVAPIELIQEIATVLSLDEARRNRFRASWESHGAVELLGDGYWAKLHEILRPAIAAYDEYERVNALSQKEREAFLAARPVRPFADNGECAANAAGLIAARKYWGDATFDRFLYESIAPTLYQTAGSSSARLSSREFWLDHWRWLEGGCR